MRPIQPSFTAGELSPALSARVDLAKYNTGCRTLSNMTVHAAGGASNRPGTRFIAQSPTPESETSGVRLIPFQYSIEQGYVLEFSDRLVRVLKDGGLVTDNDVPVEIESPYTEAQLFEISYAQSADVLYLAHGEHPPIMLSRTSHTEWTMAFVPFTDGPWLDRDPSDIDVTITPTSINGESQPDGYVWLSVADDDFWDGFAQDIELEHTYPDSFNATEWRYFLRLGFADSEDPSDIHWSWGYLPGQEQPGPTDPPNLYAYDPMVPIGYELIYNGDFETGIGGWMDYSEGTDTLTYDAYSQWAVLTKTSVDTDYYARMVQEITYFPPRALLHLEVEFMFSPSGNIRIFAGTAPGNSNILPVQAFTSEQPAVFEFRAPASKDQLYITIDNRYGSEGDETYVSKVTLVLADLNTNLWRRGAWSSRLGFPRFVCFHEQRLCFASTHTRPQTIWMSRTGSYYDFSFSSPGVDDDAINYTLASRELNAVQWLVSFGSLIAGTSDAIWKIESGGQTDAITATSITARVQSGEGCAAIAPLVIGDSILYVQRGGKVVRDLAYNFSSDAYQGKDITVTAGHLFETRRIVSWDFAALPEPTVWCAMDDGLLLGLTYMREQEVMGWHWHQTSGGYDSGDQNRLERGVFSDVCVLKTDTTDEVYVVVRRDIRPGGIYNYRAALIEKFMSRFDYEVESDQPGSTASPYDFFFVDCGLTYRGLTPASVISGLDHLDNCQVAVLADGSVLPPQTVTDGQITLPFEAGLVHVGLAYESILETLNLEVSDAEGTSQGRLKIIGAVTLVVRRTRGALVGPDEENLEELRIRNQSDLDDPIALKTGYVDVTLNSTWELNGRVMVKNIDPLPVTVLAIIPEVQLAER